MCTIPLKQFARFMGVIMNRRLSGAIAAISIFTALACSDSTSPNALNADGLTTDESRILAAIQVHLASDTIKVGQTTQATVTEQDRRGRPLHRAVTWSSSDTRVATVTDSGVVTGIAPGIASITAARDSVSGSA
ncbi:MAG TPA: Ig-like domain-containing protein, partial [Gemmatimonadaceae bacterium]|nr:Ig-like domain-containing protein [Gemmatimonadaceae bacterium]